MVQTALGECKEQEAELERTEERMREAQGVLDEEKLHDMAKKEVKLEERAHAIRETEREEAEDERESGETEGEEKEF